MFVFSLALGKQRIKAGSASLDGKVLTALQQHSSNHTNTSTSLQVSVRV